MSPDAPGVGWRGVIEEYRDFLPVTAATPVVTLLEGAPRCCRRPACPPGSGPGSC